MIYHIYLKILARIIFGSIVEIWYWQILIWQSSSKFNGTSVFLVIGEFKFGGLFQKCQSAKFKCPPTFPAIYGMYKLFSV